MDDSQEQWEQEEKAKEGQEHEEAVRKRQAKFRIERRENGQRRNVERNTNGQVVVSKFGGL